MSSCFPLTLKRIFSYLNGAHRLHTTCNKRPAKQSKFLPLLWCNCSNFKWWIQGGSGNAPKRGRSSFQQSNSWRAWICCSCGTSPLLIQGHYSLFFCNLWCCRPKNISSNHDFATLRFIFHSTRIIESHSRTWRNTRRIYIGRHFPSEAYANWILYDCWFSMLRPSCVEPEAKWSSPVSHLRYTKFYQQFTQVWNLVHMLESSSWPTCFSLS